MRVQIKCAAGIFFLSGCLAFFGCRKQPVPGPSPADTGKEDGKSAEVPADWPVFETEWMKFAHPPNWTVRAETLNSKRPDNALQTRQIAFSVVDPPPHLNESRVNGVFIYTYDKDFRPVRDFVNLSIKYWTRNGDAKVAGGVKHFKVDGGQCASFLLEYIAAPGTEGPCSFPDETTSKVCYTGGMHVFCKTDSGHPVEVSMMFLPYLVSGNLKTSKYPWQLEAFEPLLRSLEFKGVPQ